MDLSKVWMVQGTLFLLTFVGYILYKVKMIHINDKKVLTNLVIYVFLPCSIAYSFQMEFTRSLLMKFKDLLIMSLIVMVVSYILSLLLYNKQPLGRKNVLRYGTLISNAAFIGNPVAESFYGAVGLMYASIYVIPVRLVMWTVALSLFTKEKDLKNSIIKVLIHPCMIAVYIGGFMMVTGLRFTGSLDNSIYLLSRCTTPVTMLLIGAIIGEVKDLRSVLRWQVFRYSFIRLVFIPAIIYGIGMLLDLDPTVHGLSVLLAAMPAGSSTALLSAKYNCDYIFATEIVVLSTLLSLITIPILGMILL